ncbi:MAG TPA: TylF/MycF/NovP-related O-methyltransferase [Aliidongia sp.]|nr:TylF/MycF/NovP-related O-methyltransferase [Aliidongia sp.]
MIVREDGLTDRYLDLLELVLTGALTEDPPIQTESHRILITDMVHSIYGPTATVHESAMGYNPKLRETGWDWPSTAFTMVGLQRLRNFRALIERAIVEQVPGDIIETGVWRGGASIFARAILAVHDIGDRKVIVADSFEGLPPPDITRFPADQGSVLHEFRELAVSLEQVQANFAKFGLLDDQVVFLKGWFRDTMRQVPSERLAIMRLDGDMYESTIDPLNHLYDRLAVGGWVIIDDYCLVEGCRQALHDFLGSRGLTPEILPIDGVGVYFQKTR